MIIRRGQREVSWDDAVSKINKNKPATTTAETGSVNIVTPVAEEKESTTASQTKSVDELVEQADMFVGYADYVQAGTALEQAHRQAPEDNYCKIIIHLLQTTKICRFHCVIEYLGH